MICWRKGGRRASHYGTQESPGAECIQPCYPQLMSSARSLLIHRPMRAERLLLEIESSVVTSGQSGRMDEEK